MEEIKAKIDLGEDGEKTKSKRSYFYSVLLALCFYFFVQITFGAIGLLFFFIAFVPINALIDNKKARKIIIELAISAVVSPFIAYGLFSSFDTTEELNPFLVVAVFIVVALIFEAIRRFIFQRSKRHK